MVYYIKNDIITISVNELGAELSSIKHNKTNKEYLWDGDPTFWRRQSPILFPFVGSSKNKAYTYQGQTYSMMQHGFARDLNFKLIRHTKDEIWFGLDYNEETLLIYPFQFRLELGYRLTENRVHVMWRVKNNDKKTMYFSIGGHPAFHCPISSGLNQEDYYLDFHVEKPIDYLLVNMENGLEVKSKPNSHHILTTDHGIIPIVPHMFDNDALIIENHQCDKISLLNPDKTPYLTVSFDAPLFGIWSPARKKAPFVCIEPWFGRCDSEDFDGTLEEKDFINMLEPDTLFETGYVIELS